MSIFYCEVLDRTTKKTLASYENIKAKDWYFARSIIASQFIKDFPELKNKNWVVDSIEMEEEGGGNEIQ